MAATADSSDQRRLRAPLDVCARLRTVAANKNAIASPIVRFSQIGSGEQYQTASAAQSPSSAQAPTPAHLSTLLKMTRMRFVIRDYSEVSPATET